MSDDAWEKRRHQRELQQNRQSHQRELTDKRITESRERRKQQLDLYEKRLEDREYERMAKGVADVDTEKEITRREVMLQKFAVAAYRQKLEDDYHHDVRTRNLDIQEHFKRTRIDTDAQIEVIREEGSQLQKEINARLQSALAEKYADHEISMREKELDGKIEINRMREETMLKMDFEEFMHNLRQSTSTMNEDEIQASYERLRKTGKINS